MKAEATFAELYEEPKQQYTERYRESCSIAGTTENSQPAYADQNRSRSVSDAMSIHLELAESNRSLDQLCIDLPTSPTHVVRLGTTGLQMLQEQELNNMQQVWIVCRLGPDKQPVICAAEVHSCESKKDHTGAKRYDTILHYKDTTEKFQAVVQAHINYVVSKTCCHLREYTYTPRGQTSNAT